MRGLDAGVVTVPLVADESAGLAVADQSAYAWTPGTSNGIVDGWACHHATLYTIRHKTRPARPGGLLVRHFFCSQRATCWLRRYGSADEPELTELCLTDHGGSER